MGYRLRVAIEDRFLVLCLSEESHLLPEEESLDSILATARSLDPGIQILCDLRGSRAIYNDIPEALNVAVEYGAQLLAPPRDISFLRSELAGAVEIHPISAAAIPLQFAELPLFSFDRHARDRSFFEWESLSEGLDRGLPTEQDWEYATSRNPTTARLFKSASSLQRHWNLCHSTYRLNPSNPGGIEVLQRRFLQRFIDSKRRKSLLSCLRFEVLDGKIDLRCYHAGALNVIEAGADTVVGRPAIHSARTDKAVGLGLLKFEELISNRKTSERQIQEFLEQHPTILEALGYRNIYPQVVLEREDGTSLRPDFFLEPLGS